MSLDHYWLFWLQNALEVIQFASVFGATYVGSNLFLDWVRCPRAPDAPGTATVYVFTRPHQITSTSWAYEPQRKFATHDNVAWNNTVDGTLWLEGINHNTIAVYASGEWTHFTTEPQ